MPIDTPLPVSAIILAGGKARRLGNCQKALLKLNGKPLLQYVIDRLQPQVQQIVISANVELDQYRAFGLAVYPDKLGEDQGPLSGIASCIEHLQHDTVVVVPCDTPFLPIDLVSRMSSQNHSGFCIAFDGRREQVLTMLFRRKLATKLGESVVAGQRKVMEWVHRQQPTLVDFSDKPDAFFNINTPEDLATARQELSRVE